MKNVLVFDVLYLHTICLCFVSGGASGYRKPSDLCSAQIRDAVFDRCIISKVALIYGGIAVNPIAIFLQNKFRKQTSAIIRYKSTGGAVHGIQKHTQRPVCLSA